MSTIRHKKGIYIKPDLILIKVFLTYNVWEEFSKYVQVTELEEDLRIIYRTVDSFHKNNEEKKDLSLDDLSLLLFSTHLKNKEFYEGVLSNLKDITVDHSLVVGYIDTLHKNRVLRDLAMAAYEVSEGKRAFSEVQEKYESLSAVKPLTETTAIGDLEFTTTNLEEIVQKTVKKPGLQWRLNTLNRALGSLRKGDFGFIFARPETGKTTFLASEITYMLDQTDQPILWCNNEEQGEKVVLRVYQAYFGITLQQLLANVSFFNAEFQKATKGRFKLLDSASLSKLSVESTITSLGPGLVIFDQIDKIQGFDADREDLRMGHIYQWGRELAKTFCPVIGVCQADGSGEGVRYLTMQNVTNAKTAKQAEADWILGIGCVPDSGYENVRFFSIPKNKLMGDMETNPNMRHGKFEALIEPEIARYRDIS